MKKFWKKKVDPLPDPVELGSDSIIYPPGAPLIAGGDNVYAVYSALSIALVTLHNFEIAMPEKAKQLFPVSEVWRTLYQKLQLYADAVEQQNAPEDDM